MKITQRVRGTLAQIGAFALAGVLLYLALRGVDLDAVVDAIETADYRWLAPLVAIVVASHLFRAWRWKILLDALPPDEISDEPRDVSLKISFFSVMIGYMVNYAAPRLGELARTANLSSQEKIRFSSVFGTVVADRVLDMGLLAVSLLTVPLLVAGRLEKLGGIFIEPVLSRIEALPGVTVLILVVVVAVLVALVFWHTVQAEESALRRLWHGKVRPTLTSFTDGMRTVIRSPQRLAIVVSTVGMWICYLFMAFLPFVMLGMTRAYGITLLDTWVIMLLGAIGIVIPSPGGVGSYHFITIQTLVQLFAVDPEPAATYAVLAHATQLVLYVSIGLICLLLQGSSLRSLRKRTAKAKRDKKAST